MLASLTNLLILNGSHARSLAEQSHLEQKMEFQQQVRVYLSLPQFLSRSIMLVLWKYPMICAVLHSSEIKADSDKERWSWDPTIRWVEVESSREAFLNPVGDELLQKSKRKLFSGPGGWIGRQGRTTGPMTPSYGRSSDVHRWEVKMIEMTWSWYVKLQSYRCFLALSNPFLWLLMLHANSSAQHLANMTG